MDDEEVDSSTIALDDVFELSDTINNGKNAADDEESEDEKNSKDH